jgi:hypothetical protein
MERPEGITEEEWYGLSETEREGLVDTDEAIEPEVPEAPEQPEAPEVAELPEAPEEPEPPQAAADDVLLAFKPVITEADLKIEEQIPPELQIKLDELKADFDEGEMNIHEYSEARDKINRQIYKHNAAIEEQSRNDAQWQKEQLFFLQNRPEYLPGQQSEQVGKIRANALFGALNETVKSLSQDDANAHLSGMQILVKADAIVKEAFGVKKEGAKPTKPPAPLPDHKTLSDVPVAGSNEVESDAFAQLDKLTGAAFEAALERLSPEMRDAYAARA